MASWGTAAESSVENFTDMAVFILVIGGKNLDYLQIASEFFFIAFPCDILRCQCQCRCTTCIESRTKESEQYEIRI